MTSIIFITKCAQAHFPAGKMLTGLRIVSMSGTQASFRRVFLRQTLGYFVTVITLVLGSRVTESVIDRD